MTSRETRSKLVETLELDLIGPSNDHECAHELLPESPYKWYLTGYLLPSEAPESHRFDPGSSDDIDQPGDAAGTDDNQPVDRSAGGKSFMPSSIGLSVLASPGTKRVTLRARWGDYHWESDGVEEEADAPEADDPEATPDGLEEAEPTEVQEPGETYHAGRRKPPHRGYRREPREEEISLELEGLEPGDPLTKGLPNGRGLAVTLLVRRIQANESLDLPHGTLAISAFLVNHRQSDKDFVYRSCAFQAVLELEADAPLLPQPDLRGLGSHELEWDDQLADLQYRNNHEYSAGHGVATGAIPGDGCCRSVTTTWIPQHEVERVAPSRIEGVEFGMNKLAETSSASDLDAALAPLVSGYRAWIDKQEAQLPELSDTRRDVANVALNKARQAADRMEKGLKCLADDAKAFSAFCYANRTMARAATQRLGIVEPEWRPFQLAFILLNLPGLIDERSAERNVVDLLFFPTGGGKTEAYLGLAAFSMVLRRLRHEGPMSGGVSVLMRYTLRLLTLDQLGRAAGLVCALELEREQHDELGNHPFEIGLWVGSAATPNRMGGKGYKGPGREHTAYHKVNEFRRQTSKPSPIPLENCPWCETKFGRNSFKLLPNEAEPDNLVIRCENRDCDFSGRKRNLPILSVDEPIYRRLPAFLIATVDKFAALPWEGRAGALLGHVERYDANGYYGPMDPTIGSPLPDRLPGPDLVIQDELHLISGPLGTIAGIYETAIDSLCSRTAEDGTIVRPKILASTATVRRAREQIKALFGRSSSEVFPPPGPDLRDTYFARTESLAESNGRLYLGIAAQGRSLKVVLMRAALALLCGSKKLYDENDGLTETNPVDPYMTLLGYFNSLRELGGSRRIIEDEVVSRASKYGSRARRDPTLRYFKDRKIDYEPRELTSRVSTARVAETKRLLERYFSDGSDGGRPVDVALATNMISVGLDITRLGLMVVLGQPKGSAEYIQATSRVGRNPQAPGLVVTLLNVHKPRDRSHYEHFVAFHRNFYRAVEATSVTPFSPRALDRALAAALVGVCRHSMPEFTAAVGASSIRDKRKELEAFSRLFAERAESHDGHLSGPEAEAIHDGVLRRCSDLLDSWLKIATDRASMGASIQYQRELPEGSHPRLLHDFLESELPNPTEQFRKFRANRSMRDVEANAELVVEELNEPLNPSS